MPELKRSSLTIPIFPLPLVAFPNSFVPLHIFENRYRVMMKDVQEGDSTFGIVMAYKGGIASIGCLVKLTNLEQLEDGRMNINTLGTSRFELEELCGEKPYNQARVHILPEEEPTPRASLLARDVKQALHDVYKLSSKLDDRDYQPPEDVPTDPVKLSFWISSRIIGDLLQQQKLLELDSVEARLKSEFSFLDSARKYIGAKTALKDAFEE